MAKKIVLFFDHDPKVSGATISLRYIIESFINNNFETYLLTRKSKNDYKAFENIGCKILLYPNSPWYSIALSIHFSDDYKFFSKNWLMTILKNHLRFFIGIYLSWKTIKKIRPNLVYINEHNMFYCGLISRILKIQTFVHIRSNYIKGKWGIREWIISKSINLLSDKIIVISPLESFQILKHNKKAKEKLIIIPEFLSEGDFNLIQSQSELRNEFQLPVDKIIVVSFCGIDRLKGTHDFLNSIKIISKKRNDIFFILAGELKKEGMIKDVQNYYNEAQQLLCDPDIKRNLRIIGFTNESKKLIELRILLFRR